MATDIFLTIDDIKGDSIDAAHKDEIEVVAWSWGMHQGGSAHSGPGAGRGKVAIRDISITKYVDRSTPVLIKYCCSGRHFSAAKLTVRKAGGTPLEFLTLEMSDGLVTFIDIHGRDGAGRLQTTLNLQFAAFKYEYVPQTASGAAGASIPAQWNIARNAPS